MNEFESDYGFTPTNTPVEVDEIELLKSRLKKIRVIFLPMLEALNRDNHIPTILWENRGPILEENISLLKKLTDTSEEILFTAEDKFGESGSE